MLLRRGAGSRIGRASPGRYVDARRSVYVLEWSVFRGKLTYARTFTTSADATLIITPTRGLQSPDLPVSVKLLREFAEVDVSSDDPRYRKPLERDAARLASPVPGDSRAILLGSVATGKMPVRPARARIGVAFALSDVVHRSRRYQPRRPAAAQRRAVMELEDAVVDLSSKRRGSRPPKLDPLTRVPPDSVIQRS